jgi:hypothetical protein
MIEDRSPHVLIVSEDAALIHRATQELRKEGIVAKGCLGPAHASCFLEAHQPCPLAADVAVTIVDSPPGGSFIRYLKDVSSGDYAERLQAAHPACKVILCGAPEGYSGPTGEVLVAPTTQNALDLVRSFLTG